MKTPDVCPVIPDERYIHWSVGPEERVNLFECYVRDAMNDPLIQQLAHQFASRDPSNPAQAILDGVHEIIEYALDCGNGSCEHLMKGRLIIESGKGDCKKKSIIVAAMYRIIGIPAKVVWLHQQDSGMDSNHVAVKRCNEAVPSGDKPTAVKVYYPTNAPSCDAGGWEWVETTLPGAKVGNDPYAELQRLGGNTGRIKL